MSNTERFSFCCSWFLLFVFKVKSAPIGPFTGLNTRGAALCKDCISGPVLTPTVLLLICRHLDYLSLMAYDLHGSWDMVTGHPSGLYPNSLDTGNECYLNVVSMMSSPFSVVVVCVHAIFISSFRALIVVAITTAVAVYNRAKLL